MKMAKLEAAMRMVLEFNQALNRQEVAGMIQWMSDDCVFEHAAPAPDGAVFRGKEAVRQFWQDFFHQMPHAQREIEEIFGIGFRCVLRWRCEWVDATGQHRRIRGADIYKVKDGAICEHLSYLKGHYGVEQ